MGLWSSITGYFKNALTTGTNINQKMGASNPNNTTTTKRAFTNLATNASTFTAKINTALTTGTTINEKMGAVPLSEPSKAQQIAATNKTRYDASGLSSQVATLVEAFAKNQLGIETAYQYDQNVASAQQSLRQLLAGYKDQARVPSTAYGSNAYGDLVKLNQYGFHIAVYTPTAEWAGILDKALSAGGQTVDRYAEITPNHDTFDYFQVTNAKIQNNLNIRPGFVRNMMIDLLASGVTMWYVKDGEISSHYGNSFNVENQEVNS